MGGHNQFSNTLGVAKDALQSGDLDEMTYIELTGEVSQIIDSVINGTFDPDEGAAHVENAFESHIHSFSAGSYAEEAYTEFLTEAEAVV